MPASTPMPEQRLCKWCRGPMLPLPVAGEWWGCPHCDRPCELHKFCRTQVGP